MQCVVLAVTCIVRVTDAAYYLFPLLLFLSFSSSPSLPLLSPPRYDKNGKLTFNAKACALDYLAGWFKLDLLAMPCALCLVHCAVCDVLTHTNDGLPLLLALLLP